MSNKYTLVIDEDGNSVATIINAGEVVTIDESHPNAQRIFAAVANKEDPTRFLSISQAILSMDERVVVQGNSVFFDGVEQHNALARTILRYQQEGRDTQNLVKFMERLAENPSKRGRETIFEWISERELVIDDEGRFIAWKGVQDDHTSCHRGDAFVDDVEYKDSHIPNAVGSVISMPRTEIMDDPTVHCHVGLHVGTYEYANGFGAVLLEVAVDPADVVSVPSSATSWKLRCARYEVLAIHETESDEFEGDYEPEGEFTEEATLEALESAVPSSFLARLKERLKANGGKKG